MADFEITGQVQTNRNLGKWFESINLETLIHNAAEPITNAAISNAPDLSGNLRQNIKQETLKIGDTFITVGIGPDDDEAWYARFVEFGTGPHRIERNAARGLEIENDDIFASNADHPGAKSQPFLRPALDENSDKVIDSIKKEVLKNGI